MLNEFSTQRLPERGRVFINDLPAPPPGKIGFPWTEATPPLPERLPDGAQYPRLTVVTPSFNQAQFLEETIRSVLLQGYPDLEYIIMDGGSTDGSLEIIHKYAPWLVYWESAPDRGQAHAINKGWQRATGEILAWLNSDDVYAPGAVISAVEAFRAHPDACMVYSDCQMIDEASMHVKDLYSQPFDMAGLFADRFFVPQPTVFIRFETLQSINFLDESLQLIMDYDLYLRLGLASQQPIIYLPGVFLARFRMHSASKSASQVEGFILEALQIWEKLFVKPIPQEVASVQKLAYSLVYFKLSLAKARNREAASAMRYLFKSFQTYPFYAFRRWRETIWVIMRVVYLSFRSLFDLNHP